MLHFLSSLFAPSSQREPWFDDDLLDRAIERVVDGSDPRLRALPGYRKRLSPFAESAVRHVVTLVSALPEAAEISREAFLKDPRLRAFFVSADDLQEVIGNCPAVRSYLATLNGAVPEEVFGLLSMEYAEKNILGMDLRGDTLQREVKQVAVNFFNHRYLGPSDNDTETRREVMRRAFDFLVQMALQGIVTARSKKAELEQQRTLLQRKLKTMEAGSWGLASVFTESDATQADPGELETQIQAIETELLGLGSSPQALEHSLEQIGDTLGRPDHWLSVQDLSLELNPMSIKTSNAKSGPSYTLELTEVLAANSERRIVMLGRFPTRELPPQPDFLKEAERYIR